MVSGYWLHLFGGYQDHDGFELNKFPVDAQLYIVYNRHISYQNINARKQLAAPDLRKPSKWWPPIWKIRKKISTQNIAIE